MTGERTPRDFYLQWHFTDNCNLRCAHCYQTGYALEDIEEAHLQTIANSIEDALRQWKRLGRISLTGGEPFLRRDRLFSLLERFSTSPQIEWLGILTNGTLINGEDADRLSRFPKLREVQVSLDGVTAKTHDLNRGAGVFDKATKALRLLRTYGVPTSIMFTMTRRNLGQVTDVLDLALDLGVDAVTVERVMPLGQGKMGDLSPEPREVREAFQAVAQRKRDLGDQSPLRIRTSRPLWCLTDEGYGGFCPAGLTSLCILHDGTAVPCRRLEVPLGNVITDGLYKIWYGSPVLWDLRQKNRIKAACKRCEYLGKCGGCRAAAYAWSGNYLGDDPHCWKQGSADNAR